MINRLDISSVIERQGRSRFLLLVLVLVCCVVFLEGFDAQIQGYTAPALIDLWHIPQSRFASVFVFFQFGFMIGAVALGTLGDIAGKRCLVAYVFLFGLFTIAGAWADNVSFLGWTRFLSALFVGGGVPTAIALLVDYSPQGKRALHVGIMFVFYTVGGAAGGFLSAWLVPAFGWQSLYWFCGLLAIALSAVLYFLLPETLSFLLARRRDRASAVVILRKIEPGLRLDGETDFVQSGDIEQKVPVFQLFDERRLPLTVALWVAYAANMVALHFTTSWLPAILQSSGAGYRQSVVATGLFQGGGAIGSIVGGLLLDRPRGIARVAAVCAMAAPVLLGIGLSVGNMPLLMAFAAGAGLCIVSTQTGLNALSGVLYPSRLRATGAGWANGMGRVGAMLGPLLGGYLLSARMPFWQIFLIAGIPALFCAFVLRMLAMMNPKHI